MRLELGIAGEQHLVSRFERAQVLALLLGQLLEHGAAARVAGNRCGTRIELQPAPLRGDRDAQGVPAKSNSVVLPSMAGAFRPVRQFSHSP